MNRTAPIHHTARTTIKRATILGVLLAAPSLSLAAARVELQPSNKLVVDQPAQLSITVDGESTRPPSLAVPNADVDYHGAARKMTSINGRTSDQTVFLYTIVPHSVGALDIPSLRVDGEQTKPVHASVVAERSAPQAARAEQPTRAYVRLDMPKRTIYVGEAVPIRIRAYFRAGVAATLQGQPHLTSSAFTLADLSDKPTQRQVDIDGVPYLEATWTGVLSAAKSTKDKIAIELPVEIAYREQRPARSMRDIFGDDPFGDAFDDPFFADADPFAGIDMAFDTGPLQQQQLTLRHALPKTRIAELPEANRPADFTGAVGQFELASELPSGELRVGEPATLTFRVSGTGNFDRVNIDGIAASNDWKVYPGKPTLADGTKTFTQTIVPTHPGSLTIPAVSFSFFDPKMKQYRTVHTRAETRDVSPGAVVDRSLTTTTNRVEQGPTTSTLVPLIQRRSFWQIPGALLAAMLLVFAMAWNRRSESASRWRDHRRVSRRVRQQRARLAAAARGGDGRAFFDAARAALQLQLAETWGVRPETITAADIEARMGDDGAVIREVFEQADNIKYAHHDPSRAALESWRSRIDAQLKTLEVTR